VGPKRHSRNDRRCEAKLAEKGLTAVGYGVIKLGKDAASDRKVFEFCKNLGIGIVISEPDVAGMDGIEALVKEFDIKMAIHNHPKRPLDRAYLFWDPKLRARPRQRSRPPPRCLR
jgi:hypothetical protein